MCVYEYFDFFLLIISFSSLAYTTYYTHKIHTQRTRVGNSTLNKCVCMVSRLIKLTIDFRHYFRSVLNDSFALDEMNIQASKQVWMNMSFSAFFHHAFLFEVCLCVWGRERVRASTLYLFHSYTNFVWHISAETSREDQKSKKKLQTKNLTKEQTKNKQNSWNVIFLIAVFNHTTWINVDDKRFISRKFIYHLIIWLQFWSKLIRCFSLFRLHKI